jgi:hypothetical protein
MASKTLMDDMNTSLQVSRSVNFFSDCSVSAVVCYESARLTKEFTRVLLKEYHMNTLVSEL